MTNANVKIKKVSVYHPDHIVDNDYYFSHFDSQGKDIRGLLAVTGRNKRYLSTDPNETPLTMGIEAARRALAESGLAAEDLDMIVFSSGTPEYVQPTNALKVHHALGGKSSARVFDMNANCVGMVIALEQASRHIIANPRIKYAMIVGAEQMNKYSRTDEEVPYANFGDAAAALILERVEDEDCGILDSSYYTDSSMHDTIVLPATGFSNIYRQDLSEYDKRIEWLPFDTDEAFISARNAIERSLADNGLTKANVKKYFLSQFAKKNIDGICEQLGEDLDKFKYVGDEFGYTGTSSPFIALSKSIEEGEIERGDHIVFWSVGAGITSCNILFRY
ncbi:ketoacyl-ACP synthase III [Paenibacillus sp. NFR01]|uniref:ketoacyl-ACP synthase III n=1 Tax=Paenibacillus sp. NFR01 TaxID=1566279 RepID=UPI0008C856E8|nr:ketoacyl-ACP synthase III [Paenibacillus sp. NFR01]SES97403.1 3-oxoacyl-[acyl-carrier-protein] synthase-3 [Paenibacillus sp. NFR01]